MHLHNSLSVYRLPIHSRDPVPSSLSLSLSKTRFLEKPFFHFFLSFFLLVLFFIDARSDVRGERRA